MTGDRVDVIVDLRNGERCVVEIEVEGQSTMVGAHQALKYRALRAGELDNGDLPHAFLVAYSIPDNVKAFCERHGYVTLEFPDGPGRVTCGSQPKPGAGSVGSVLRGSLYSGLFCPRRRIARYRRLSTGRQRWPLTPDSTIR